ncbi:hypothetical protein ACFLU6_05465 [Acidobacteriota bacterium]
MSETKPKVEPGNTTDSADNKPRETDCVSESLPKKRARGERKDPSRSRRTHGLDAYRTRRVLPPGSEDVQAEVKLIAQGLAEDRGGEDKLSTAQRLLISLACSDLTYIMLCDKYLCKHPKEILRKTRAGVNFAPVLQKRGSFVNSVRAHLVALGIDGVANKPERLEDYIAKLKKKPCKDIQDGAEDDNPDADGVQAVDSDSSVTGDCTASEETE